MRPRKFIFLLGIPAVIAAGVYGAGLISRGFSTADQPSFFERAVARGARNLAIPRKARGEKDPWKATPEDLLEARGSVIDHCAVCHGQDGSGETQAGRNL